MFAVKNLFGGIVKQFNTVEGLKMMAEANKEMLADAQYRHSEQLLTIRKHAIDGITSRQAVIQQAGQEILQLQRLTE